MKQQMLEIEVEMLRKENEELKASLEKLQAAYNKLYETADQIAGPIDIDELLDMSND